MLLAEPTDQYLRTFAWNKVKYRADKPLAELIDSLQKVSEALPRQSIIANTRGLGTGQHRQRCQGQNHAVQPSQDKSHGLTAEADVSSYEE